MMRRLCVSFGLWMPSQKHQSNKICLGIILISLLTYNEVDSKVNYLEKEVYRKLMQGGKMEIGLKSVWLKLIFLSFFLTPQPLFFYLSNFCMTRFQSEVKISPIAAFCAQVKSCT